MPCDTLFPHGNTMFEMFTGLITLTLKIWHTINYEWMTGKEWISMPGVMVNTGKGYKDFEAESKLI